MNRSMFRAPLTVAAMAVLVAVPTSMSDPLGVYAIVDRVVISPDSATVQVWGNFAISDRQPGDHYVVTGKGYLFYKVNPAHERESRTEWADLRTVAGKKAIVGFGQRWQPTTLGRVRCATEAPSQPDVYPVAIGVSKMPDQRNTGWVIANGLLDKPATDAKCGAR